MIYVHYVLDCPDGYSTDKKADTCFPCSQNKYGQRCGRICSCSENER